MMRSLLVLTAMVAGVSSFVYTCNEVKRILASDDEFSVNGTRACVVLPAGVNFPYNEDPYTWYLYNTYITDTGSGSAPKVLDGILGEPTMCIEGVGPWTMRSDYPDEFKCTSKKFKYAEIAIIFTSDEPNIVSTSIGATTAKYGKGTHVFVSLEGALRIDKKSIDGGKETNFQLYAGAGQNEQEERFSLMPEKFVSGTSTIVLGPVTTLVIEDDVTIELTLTSLDDELFLPADPGFSYSIMTTGRANDLQSARNISVSTRFGINDDSIAYDAVSITGTVKMDDNVPSAISIDCSSEETGDQGAVIIDKSQDVYFEEKCSALKISFMASIAPEDIGRSNEFIYLRVQSNSDPATKTTAAPAAVNVTDNYCQCGIVDDWFEDDWDPAGIWVDVVIILDTSQSMGESLEEAKSLITSFVGLMSTDVNAEFYSRVGVIAMADTVQVIYNLNMSNTDDLDSVQQHKIDKIDVGAAFQAALSMFADGTKLSSYRENAKQIIYYLTNSAPGANMNGVDDFKTGGGVIIMNDFVLEGDVADAGLKKLASDNFFFTDLSDNYINSLAVFCEANCFCNPSMHPFNDDDKSPRTQANRGCFHPVNNGIPQPKARDTCQKEHGGALVSVHDADKEFFVSGVVSIFGAKKKYWLGLQNDGNQWSWDDKSTDPYNSWDAASGQPNTNGGKNECAYAVQTTGFNVLWTAANCQAGGVIYVCESAPCSRGNKNC